jgi:hypothetical protein
LSALLATRSQAGNASSKKWASGLRVLGQTSLAQTIHKEAFDLSTILLKSESTLASSLGTGNQ